MVNSLAKPFAAILTSKVELLGEILSRLEARLGRVDFVGEWHPFVHTHYYEAEMGADLKRCVVSFERTLSADKLPDMKSWAKEIEGKYSAEGKRKVNIDPGYVDLHKVVLGSGKGGGHMILLGKGVFADVLLWYNKGWQPVPWAYPDFKDGTYFRELEEIRSRFKEQVPH